MMYNNLIETYERNGIPLSEVLDYLEVNEDIYFNWAKRGNIPASVLVKLSEKLNCSVDCLLNLQNSSGI